MKIKTISLFLFYAALFFLLGYLYARIIAFLM
jgi:hypothetical protein